MRVLLVTSEWPTEDRPSAGCFVAAQVEAIRDLGHDIHVFHFRGAKSPSSYFRAWRRIQALVNKGDFDLVHAHFGQSGILALQKKIPVIVTLHGSDINGVVAIRGKLNIFAGKILHFVSRVSAYFATEVIVVAANMKSRLGNVKCNVIPCGLDFRVFKPHDQALARKALGLNSDCRKLILFAGHPDNPIKRYDLAQDAVTRANALTGENIDLLYMEGESPERVSKFMNACDLLLLTSSSEGSPMVVKEALACDLPIVSVNVGDVADRLADIRGSIVCSNHSADELANAICKVLSSNLPYESRAQVSQLDNRILAEKCVSVYRKALGSDCDSVKDLSKAGG